MTHNTLHSHTHPRSLESGRQGERKTDLKFMRRRLAALATVVALGSGIAFAKSGSHESGQPLWQQMDATIERELHKGPSGSDVIVYDGVIGAGNTVQGVVAREYPELSESVLQHKANNASALEAQPEDRFLQPTDEVVIWEDAELKREFGETAILGAIAER